MKISTILGLVVATMVCTSSTASARQFYRIPLPPGVIRPESIAFDCQGRGPYVGVSDARIFRHEPLSNTWTEFAVMPNRHLGCHGSPDSEAQCGRPLGLAFHPLTCDLYVADAYNGLVKVNQTGGRGVSVATGAEGIPFKFTNALSIDSDTGVVYFTDSSSRFGRSEFGRIFETTDNTGRLISYNPSNGKVNVLRRHLQFPNGVALSRNNDFLLFDETTNGRVHKLWLKGPRSHTSELLITVRGRPDNINRDSNGNFWIAQVKRPFGASGDGGMPVNINEQGQILERLDARGGGELITSASDVKEHGGRVWIGSVVNNFVQVSL